MTALLTMTHQAQLDERLPPSPGEVHLRLIKDGECRPEIGQVICKRLQESGG